MLTIALKELIDALRDTRAIVSSVFYCLMGPGIVWMVSRALGNNAAVLAGMISVFALVAAFSGGMNVAMDVVAGERERRSLVPLIGNPVSRLEIILGKWIAVMLFSLGGFLLCLAGFHLVYAPNYGAFPFVLATGMIPLACLAAALEVGLSTLCRSVKEAHTYLSMVVFVPMVIGMGGVFFPANALWYSILPVAGQHQQLQHWLSHEPVAILPSVFLGLLTTVASAAILYTTAEVLERDDAIYGR